ncbi:MAG: YdiU family protein [Acidobacteria bacterium]|nr:YdiU family protein [Acidobacteriota bacterium]
MLSFENTYARLPAHFYARVSPTPVPEPRLVHLNGPLARELGIDPATLATPDGVAILGGNRIPDGAEPLAMAYAGFQFGHWVPQLGDGRAILLGEVIGRDGVRRDVQLKGAGPTPFSRGGDGRAGLGPVLREYVVSEAMFRLGVPTTRALAAVTTGALVARDTLLPGAVLVRVAQSHLRVGTFQFFAGRNDRDALRTLADYALARHDPDAVDQDHPYVAFFRGVVERQATLMAHWQRLGFIHGVMNTDNTSIAGETIDYGPCAFMDAYHPDTVFSSIDRMGRYAFGRQPSVAHWNLQSLARAVLPLLADEDTEAVARANEVLEGFVPRFETTYLSGMRQKLGLTEVRDDDASLADALLQQMAASGADFTLTFRELSDALDDTPIAAAPVRRRFADHAAFDAWVARWRRRLAAEPGSTDARRERMRLANPLYIPRNHLVAEVIAAATMEGDFGPFETLVDVLSRPHDEQPGRERYARAPKPDQVVRQTFCGT